MNIWGKFLKWKGWKLEISAPKRDKCVICVAPHTSNIDFFLGLAAYRSLGREANFLMKRFWFFFPLSLILKHFGGIPVGGKNAKGKSLTAQIISDFKDRPYLNLAITPEGTRSRQPEWHTGFLRIAIGAGVPIQLGVIDFGKKLILIKEEFMPSGDLEKDMAKVKTFYSQFPDAARYPEKFAI